VVPHARPRFFKLRRGHAVVRQIPRTEADRSFLAKAAHNSPTQAIVIINPVSGPVPRNASVDRVDVARRALADSELSSEVSVTEAPGHAYELARAAVERGAPVVCAWGGDGTINEVVRALAFSSTALGIVPGGSGNGFARELGIPLDPREALKHLTRAAARRIDVGELGGRLFCNVAGIGLDARVAARVGTDATPRGLRGYLMTTSRELLSYQPVEYQIEADHCSFSRSALVVALANSRQYGYGTRIAPTAELDDGLLDLVVVEGRSLAGNLVRVPSLYTGRFHKAAGVMTLKVWKVEVVAEAPMVFHVDGEPVVGDCRLTARVHPGALNVLA